MRKRDDSKKQALVLATIKVVNELGFAASSVSKIAKEAGVSVATLYIYFENKEDLLLFTHLELKAKLSAALMSDFDSSLPVKTLLRGIWLNLFNFVDKEAESYKYIDQFTNSPFNQRVDSQAIALPYRKLHEKIEEGKREGILKDVPIEVVFSFLFAPAVFLARSHLTVGFNATHESINSTFSLAWDAISA